MRATFCEAVSIGALSLLLTRIRCRRAAGKLPPSEIKTTFFNGQPFTASTPSNVKYKMTFRRTAR